MPEYLAPGVYVEETSFRSKSIEGVSTTTTGFIGPARYGSSTQVPDLLTSLGEFERAYGDGQPLAVGADGHPQEMTNFLWQAARAFFLEGGKRLYVVRIFRERTEVASVPSGAKGTFRTITHDAHAPDTYIDTGVAAWDPPLATPPARLLVSPPASPPAGWRVQAPWPGAAGNRQVRFTLHLGQNVLNVDRDGNPTVRTLQPHDMVWIGQLVVPAAGGAPLSPPAPAAESKYDGRFYAVDHVFDPDTQGYLWTFTDSGTRTQQLLRGADWINLAKDQIRVVTLSVTVFAPSGAGPLTPPEVIDNL